MKYIEMAKKNGKKIISTVLCAAMIVTGAAFAPAVGIYAEENNTQEDISSDVENIAEETTAAEEETEESTAGETAAEEEITTAEEEEELEDDENVSNIALFAANSAVAFDYNGYPYGIISDSTITLNAALKSGTAQTVEWYRSDSYSKDGNYTKIDGADALSYTFTADNDTAYWYKCSVNGSYTEAVQVIYAEPNASGNKLNVYSQSGNRAWYISSGTMAYTSGNRYGAIYFDVIGTYNNNGDVIWISTSYSNGWKTDAIKQIICTFKQDEPHAVMCTAVLNEDSTKAGVYADVCLGSSDLFGSLADGASLKAVLENGRTTQIQMVGAATVDDAKKTDPAFVLQYIDKPTSFYLGNYHADNSEKRYYDYNTTESYDGAKAYEEIDGKNVVTEVAGVDSVFSMGWTGIPAGGTVRFNFNIGSVEQTGAKIQTNSEVTSTTVTVTQTEGEIGTVQFRLYDKTGNTYTDWVIPDADTKQAVFKNLTPNHTYEIQAKNVDASDDTAESMGDITTAIDPLKPGSGSTGGGEALPVESTVKADSISFKNLNPEYRYRLLDENDNDVTGWTAPSGDDNSIVFDGLQPSKKYYLVAKTDDNSQTEKVEYVTPSMLDSKKDAAKTELEQKFAEYIEAVESMEFLSDSEKAEYKSKLTESKEYWCSQIDEVASADEEGNIEQYKENGLTNMENKFSDAGKVNLSHAKENAKAEVERKAAEAKAEIEKMSDLGAEEAENAKIKIDEAKNSALEAVENAGDIEQLTAAKNTGADSIKSENDEAERLDLNNAKSRSEAEIAAAAADAKAKLDAITNLTSEEKEAVMDRINGHSDRANAVIGSVTNHDDKSKVIDAKNEAIEAINAELESLSHTEFESAKENAREQIEKAAIDAKAEIEKMSDLSAEEAETAKAKIDEAKNNALEAVENAGDIEQLTSAKNTGIDSIKSENDKAAELDLSNAKTKAKADVVAAAADAKNKIDAMNGLSNEEKTAFKADIDKKSEETIKAIDDVTVPSDKSDMEALKQHVINVIAQVKNEAAGKKNEDNKDNNDSSDAKPAVKYEDIKDTVVKPEEEFEYGNGNIKVIIESKSINAEDDTTINGFFVTSYENIVNACLDDSDKQKVAEGQKVEIRLVLTDVGDTVPETDKNVITNQLAEYSTEKAGLSLGQYIDLNLEMKVGDAQWMKIPEAKQELEITMDIPDSLKMQGAVYYIIRCHDGECTLLEDLDDNADTITIKTDKFSTYAIVYTRNAQYVAPGTGYTANMQVWFVMLVAIIAGLTVMGVGFTRKKCK